jgi:tetratricopeptide (TPR) repeat protein
MANPDKMLSVAIGLYHEGELHESAHRLEECVRECQRWEAADTEMLAMSNLSEAYMRMGRLTEAEYIAVSLLALARRHGSHADEVRAIGRLALALLAREAYDRWDELRPQLIETVTKARHIKLGYWVIQNLETLGTFSARMGDLEQGFEWLQMAMSAIGEEENEPDFFRTRIYCAIAEIMLKSKRPMRAREYANLGRLTALEVGSRHLAIISELSVARVCFGLDEPENALECALRVRTAAGREGWRIEQLAAEKLLVGIYEVLGRGELARDAANKALFMAEESGVREDVVLRLIDLARVCKMTHDIVCADENAQRAWCLARELGRSDLVAMTQLETIYAHR